MGGCDTPPTPGCFLEVLILNDFKSLSPELVILKSLKWRFSELVILEGLRVKNGRMRGIVGRFRRADGDDANSEIGVPRTASARDGRLRVTP
jgi:hypothetical protein